MPAIVFEPNGTPTLIGYGVPQPGSHTGRRTVILQLGLSSADFTARANNLGEDYLFAAGVTDSNGQRRERIDYAKARNFFRKQAIAAGFSEREVSLALSSDLLRERRGRGGAGPIDPPDPPPAPLPDYPDWPGQLYEDYLTELENGTVVVPDKDWGGTSSGTPAPSDPTPEPTLFLIEVYGISSFLGNYGMGRTIKTFTLLPGEQTTIKLKTWQSSRESIQRSSSIVDSHEQSARERFSNKIQTETTDKATQASTEKWHVEAKAKASWGWGSASVSGGASGEYQSGREQFAKQAADSLQEHANEASSKRELSVTSSSEVETETGEEMTIERTITNPNMRRTLNFVFRELNQEYITKLHLKDIRIGFSNGLANSWREASLSGARKLVEEVVVPSRVDEMLRSIFKVAGIVVSDEDTPVLTLERVTLTSPTQTSVTDAQPDQNGEFPLPGANEYYRFKRGPLSQSNAANAVEGILLQERTVVMRTDSALVEALLGEADALDDFAMEIQQAAAAERTLANRRETVLLDMLEAIPDPVQRAEAAAALFGPAGQSNA